MVSFPPGAAIGQNINTSVSRGNSLAAAAQLAQINPEVFLFNNLNQPSSSFDPFSLAASTLNASRPTALGNGSLPSTGLSTPQQVLSLGLQSPAVQAAQQAIPQAAQPSIPSAAPTVNNPFATALLPPAAPQQGTPNPQPIAPKEAGGNDNLFGSIGKAFGGFIDGLTNGNGEGAAAGASIGGLIDGLTGDDVPPKAATPAKGPQKAKGDDDDDEEEDDDIDIDI